MGLDSRSSEVAGLGGVRCWSKCEGRPPRACQLGRILDDLQEVGMDKGCIWFAHVRACKQASQTMACSGLSVASISQCTHIAGCQPSRVLCFLLQVVSTDHGGIVCCWDLMTGELLHSFSNTHGGCRISTAALDDDCRRLITGIQGPASSAAAEQLSALHAQVHSTCAFLGLCCLLVLPHSATSCALLTSLVCWNGRC